MTSKTAKEFAAIAIIKIFQHYTVFSPRWRTRRRQAIKGIWREPKAIRNEALSSKEHRQWKTYKLNGRRIVVLFAADL